MKTGVLSLVIALSLSACSVPFLRGDDTVAAATNDPAELLQGLEEIAVQAADTELTVAADTETPVEELVQADDLQAVTLDDLDDDFLAAMRDTRLAHPVLGIFNDTDMLRVAQGTCGTLQHQASYDPVIELLEEQLELRTLSELAGIGVEEWIYTSSEVFCPLTVEGLRQ